jgi:hypothetical protein
VHLTNAPDGIPPAAFLAAAMVLVVSAGLFIVSVFRTARAAANCCPHPDLDDEDREPAGASA